MARNPNSDTWNQNHRYSQSDDRIMRRGDDRTRDSQDWGSQHQGQERNSYRTDDYPTDKEMYRAGSDRYDRDMAYGNYGSRNTHNQGQQNFNQDRDRDRGNLGSYGWSNDYRSTQDYRPSESRSEGRSWTGSDNQSMSMGRSQGRQDEMYGQGGDLSSSRSYGSGMSNFGSSTSDSYRGGSFGSSGYGSSTGSNTGSNFAGNNSGISSSNYGAGYYGSSSSYGSGLGGNNSFGTQSQSYGQSQSQSQSQGQHFGKGPKNYRRSDERIREEVSDALERDPHIDASEIEVDVKDGVVSLRGHVEDRQTKRMTEDLVANLYGVKDVRNDLTVDQSIFTQARNMIFGESAESHSASSTNQNKSTATKSKH